MLSLVACSQLPKHNTKFYFIYWCCFWHVPEHGVATRWLWCPRVTRLGSPVNAEWLGVTPYTYMSLHQNLKKDNFVGDPFVVMYY